MHLQNLDYFLRATTGKSSAQGKANSSFEFHEVTCRAVKAFFAHPVDE